MPTIAVTVLPTALRILDIMPYNDCELNCTAQAIVEGQSVPLSIAVIWTRQQNGSAEENVPSSDFTTSGSPGTGYRSTLSRREGAMASIFYYCTASLVISNSIQGSSQAVVTVVGKHGLCPHMGKTVHAYWPCVCVCVCCPSMCPSMPAHAFQCPSHSSIVYSIVCAFQCPSHSSIVYSIVCAFQCPSQSSIVYSIVCAFQCPSHSSIVYSIVCTFQCPSHSSIVYSIVYSIVCHSSSVTCTLSTGPTAPVVSHPFNAIDIFGIQVTIQWTVPSIAYIPETYMVQYGQFDHTLSSNSSVVASGADISITDKTYHVVLMGLEPVTEYFYRVVSTNTVGQSTTAVDRFNTTNRRKYCRCSNKTVIYYVLYVAIRH